MPQQRATDSRLRDSVNFVTHSANPRLPNDVTQQRYFSQVQNLTPASCGTPIPNGDYKCSINLERDYKGGDPLFLCGFMTHIKTYKGQCSSIFEASTALIEHYRDV